MKKSTVFSPPGEAIGRRDQPTYEQLTRQVEELERQLCERVRSEEALRESEQQYRSLVENTSDVIFTLSVDGAVTSLNSAFELLTGWARNDWLGKPFFFLLHPEDLSFATQLFRRVVQKETPPVFVLRMRTSAGHYLQSELTVTPQIYEHTVIGVLGAMRDVTQRKRMEQALAHRTALEGVITTISG
jgi:PAS domain S-box-containing protein